jgi:hypothetical protein
MTYISAEIIPVTRYLQNERGPIGIMRFGRIPKRYFRNTTRDTTVFSAKPTFIQYEPDDN